VDLEIYANREEIGTLILGSGSLFWFGRKRQKRKRIAWSRFAEMMDELAYGAKGQDQSVKGQSYATPLTLTLSQRERERVSTSREVTTMKASTKELDELLSQYSANVQEVARGLRGMILATVPDANEMVDAPARVIGYGHGDGYKGMICTIILSKKEVKLGVVGGASLPDPKGLMEGAGKKHRYVVLNEAADLKKKKGIAELIKAKNEELRAKR
jgi:hypothetical protein